MSNPLNISPEAETDYDNLLESMLSLIENWMEEQVGFVPCGAVVTTEGELVGHMAAIDEETPTPEAVMHTLLSGFQEEAEAGRIRASCACYDGGFEEEGEFIPATVLILEHRHGPATLLYRPYRRNDDGTYDYAQIGGQQVTPEVFVQG